ncbi:hypothetical protein N0V90_009118 [Kalmusia sp. IMI 367209]|nr:hypothetical protein N0V90_009118 [Kalmusia sp. IMI 367209]
MTEEHFNTAISAFSGLDILLKRCIQSLDIWQRANDSTASFASFKARLEFQCAKLNSWAQQWGIENDQQLSHDRFRGFEIMGCLRLIYRLAYDLSRLDNGFPTLSKSQNLSAMDRYSRIRQMGSWMSIETDGLDEVDSTSTLLTYIPEPLKWALQQEKSEQSLSLLRVLIQDLCEAFPPPRYDPSGYVVLGSFLESQDATALARASDALDSTTLPGRLAWAKSVSYGNGFLGSATRTKTLRLEEPKLLLGRERETNRFEGTYDGSKVLVERKQITTAPGDIPTRGILDARIDNIALRLEDPLKPIEFRTLPCAGMTIKEEPTADRIQSTYCLVYCVDTPWFSLRSLISRGLHRTVPDINHSFPLGHRFRIAQNLARAVMHLHVASWLHKAFKSENILFFGSDEANAGRKLPYLAGFEYSRPDAEDERTEEVVANDESSLYRHPKAGVVPKADSLQPLGAAGNYSKVYDVYSLGVVLIELGLFESASSIVKPNASKRSPRTEIRSALVENAIPKLRFTCGDIYAEVASKCINGFFEQVQPRELDRAFYIEIVRKLDLCSA